MMATPYNPNSRYVPWRIKIGDLVLIRASLVYHPASDDDYILAVLVEIKEEGVDKINPCKIVFLSPKHDKIAIFLSPEHGKIAIFLDVVENEVVVSKANRYLIRRAPKDENETG